MRVILILLAVIVVAAAAIFSLRLMGSGLEAKMEEVGSALPPATDNAVAITPVVAQIDRTMARTPANGGSAVVLFTPGPADRNLVTCVNIWGMLDSATASEIQIGLRKAEDGTVEALRPLYWLTTAVDPSPEPQCETLMASYDYARAETVRRKQGLSGEGPHLVVSRDDERTAAVIDLTGRSDREIADLVRYFRDGFAYRNDIWDPALAAPDQRRSALSGFFGARFRETFVTSVSLVLNPAARAGCALGDLADAPCT